MAEKRIMQETFDLAVEENMEEFLMSKEEAIADAIKIFKCQGFGTRASDRDSRWRAVTVASGAMLLVCQCRSVVVRTRPARRGGPNLKGGTRPGPPGPAIGRTCLVLPVARPGTGRSGRARPGSDSRAAAGGGCRGQDGYPFRS
jgi:hypothetical protein